MSLGKALALALMESEAEEQEDSGPLLPIKDLLAAYQDKQEFAAGDVVTWKPGLKNRRGKSSETFTVVRVLATPVLDNNGDSGSAYYREPPNIRAA